jgi:uncharacterized protein
LAQSFTLMKIRHQGGTFNFRIAAAVILFACSFCFGQQNQPFSINTSPLPAPSGFVNDYAGVIDAQTKQRLETRLKEFKENTQPPIEIGIAVIRTTGGRELQEYSLAVARGWGIGSKEDDNPSALLMVAIDDRKYFTQVSKDLEDELPDGVVGSLQRQFLVPEFKKGNYAKGISDTVEAYIATIEGRTRPGGKAPPTAITSPESDDGSALSTFCCLAIILIIILIILSRSNRGGGGRGDRDRWGGGGFGGGGGALPWIIGSIIANAGNSSGSSSSDWGGSSGGGGFGGFGGGGDFGGGGAGGDW